MPKQMWFGNEQRMQWVPAPATGMQVNNVGASERLDYQSGRVGIYRSMQTHKEFDIDFPVQEASGLSGLDVFQKYASGFYGDGDTYPLFFADPMNYDQNLFPTAWASPGLYRRGWAGIVSNRPMGYYNLVTNPSVEVNATNYSTTAGTSGTATGARTATTSVSGLYSYRATWTVATTVVSGGVNYLNTPVTAGEVYDFSAYVTCSKIQRVYLVVRWRDGADASISALSGTQTVLAANTTTRLMVTQLTAPVGAVTADIEITAVAGTSAANWAATDWLQMDAVMINTTQLAPPAYFDGSTPGAVWTGTAGASASYMYITRNVPTTTDTAANIYNLPPIQATWNVTTVSGAYPTPANTFSDIPFAIIPIPPGYVLWMGATGSATGAAVVRVHLFNTPADITAPAATTDLTLLSSTGATRMNASFSGASYQFAKVFITRNSSVPATITLSSMMAQLWPIGVTPATAGSFIEGKGHRGLKFEDTPTVESYVLVDPNRNVPVHYKGMSTRLIEAQDRG